MTEQFGDYKSQIRTCGDRSGRGELRGTIPRKIRNPNKACRCHSNHDNSTRYSSKNPSEEI